MAEFLVPVNIIVRVKDVDELELENYMSGFLVGLSEMFSSDDPEDDHYEIENATIRWYNIKEV